MGREALGCALASQARDALSNPFASELARDCEPPSPILLRKWPCIYLFIKIKMKIAGLRLVSKRGDVVKKHPQARLRVSFPQQIQHSCSESSPCLSELSVVKSNLDFRCADDAVVRGNDSLPATRNPLLSLV